MFFYNFSYNIRAATASSRRSGRAYKRAATTKKAISRKKFSEMSSLWAQRQQTGILSAINQIQDSTGSFVSYLYNFNVRYDWSNSELIRFHSYHIPEIRIVTCEPLQAGKTSELLLKFCNPTQHQTQISLYPLDTPTTPITTTASGEIEELKRENMQMVRIY